jgi:hypothetical protein
VALRLGVDAEALVVAYLLGQPDVAAASTGGGTEIPPEATWPRWRLHRIGGTQDYPHWIEHPRFQLEAWGGTKAQAGILIRTLEAAVRAMSGVYALGVVTAVDINLSQLWQPDETDNNRPRYLSDFTATIHPPIQ